MKKLIIALLALVFSSAALAQTAVTVAVTNDQGAAMSGVPVYAFNNSSYAGVSGSTDSNGDAVLTLVDGDYRFRVDVNGTQYFSATGNHCTIPACTSVSVQIPRQVTVTVTGSAGGVEAGLQVYAFNGSTYVNKSAITDANGEADFQLLGGDYRFRIDKNGTQFFTDSANHCSVPGCSAVTYEVPESVTVTITGNSGPETGLNVYAFNGSSYVNKSAVTDANGDAVFTLLPGDYRFRIDKNGTQYFTDAVNHCSVAGCNSVAFEIPAQVSVQVDSSAGGPEAGLKVYAFDGSTYKNKSATTDANGLATFQLLAGDYRFRIDKNGTQFYTDSTNHCTVPGCTSISYEIPESVTVSVTSSGGGVEAGLHVYAFTGSSYANKSAITDSNGEAVFTLLPGDYRFRIDKNGTQFYTDSVNHCTAPGCSAVSYEVPESTTVNVLNTLGQPEPGLSVYAFDGSSYVGRSAVTDGNGDALFTLLPGNYRFRTDKAGTQYFSDAVNHCAVPGCTFVAQQVTASLSSYVMDPALGACLDAAASANGWSSPAEVTSLSCNGQGISNLSGLESFTSLESLSLVNNPVTLLDSLAGLSSLTSLDLSSNTLLECNQLGALESVLGQGVITQPATCLGEGEQVFSVENPGKPDTNQFSYALATTAAGDFVSGAITYNPVTDSFDGRVYVIDGTNGAPLLELQNPLPSGSDYFGWSVAVAANGNIVVGAWQDEVNAIPAGVVHVFDGVDGSYEFTIGNPAPEANDRFGYAIATLPSGNIAISAYNEAGGGAVYIYDGSGNLQQIIYNPGADANAEFGKSLAANSFGDVVIGAPKQDVSDGSVITDAGSVYVYPETGGTPLLIVDNPQPQSNDDYGSAVGVTATDDLIVSARYVDNNASNDGSVFLHDGGDGSLLWTQANPVADADGLFATALAGTPQGHVVVGAANDDAGASNAGKVFVLDGLTGELIKVIANPEPQANVNFGHGLAVTPAGQIAVGAFGADGGYGKLYLFSSIATGSILELLNDQSFADPALQACVSSTAAANGWATVDEVATLDCSAAGITDLTGLDVLDSLTDLNLADNDLTDISVLDSLSALTQLDLTGNNDLLCTDLDALEALLGPGVVLRPVPCSGGGGGVGPAQVDNLHNAQGQRVAKTVNGDPATTIHFIYDQAGRVIAEIDASTGQTLREYVYVNGMQVALVDDTGTPEEETYFVHGDHLGTPQKITDVDQGVVWAGSYEPFGEVDEFVAEIGNSIRFPGQFEDGETNLYYNYFRDNDPSTGRYIQSDPLGIFDGSNTYAYVYGNPINYKDPTGEFGLLGAGIGAAIEISLQLATNGGRLKCVDVADVLIAAAFGAVAPGALSSARTVKNSVGAARTLTRQVKRTRASSRIRKLENRRRAHQRALADELATQGIFQGGKAAAKRFFGIDSDDCGCN